MLQQGFITLPRVTVGLTAFIQPVIPSFNRRLIKGLQSFEVAADALHVTCEIHNSLSQIWDKLNSSLNDF